MPNAVFIYALNCPITGQTRYVGKANDPEKRLGVHLACKVRCHRTNWIQSIKNLGMRPVLEILDEVPEAEWQSWEVAWISFFRESGFDLVNATLGGEGNLGGSHSPETRAKIRASKVGKPNPHSGHSPTAETREKLRMAGLGRKDSQETSAKRSAVHKGKRHSADRCAINSAAQKKWWAENKQIAKRKPRTAEHCANLSLSHLGEKNPFFGKHHSRESIEKREATKRAIREERKLCQMSPT